MQFRSTALPEIRVILPDVKRDARGFFVETYNRRTLRELAGIDVDFLQDNHSRSEDVGVVRGLHFQIEPHAQAKLVQVLRGSILDVAVDIRHGSPNFGRHAAVMLSAENHAQVWVPKGFAHGFSTLEPGAEVLYKVSAHYDPVCEKGIAWNDPELNIDWQLRGTPILSAKDSRLPRLRDLPVYFRY
jgi:dTDP-4-dehydrorhamnose 3,5-epimerase